MEPRILAGLRKSLLSLVDGSILSLVFGDMMLMY
jgi:hypothetical protein